MSRILVGTIAASSLALIAAQAQADPQAPAQADPPSAQAAAPFTLAQMNVAVRSAASDGGGRAVVPPPPDPSATPLTISLTPYAFASSIGVDVRGGPNGTGDYSGHASFGKVLSHLKFAFMSAGEIGYGRWGAAADILYANISFSSSPRKPILDFVSGRTTVKELVSTVEGRYRVVDEPGLQLDALAGARIVAINLHQVVFLPQQTLSGTADRTTAMPLVGARVRAQLSRKWSAIAYADGGGISHDSTWQAYGGLNYHTSQHWDVAIGYRYFDLTYSNSPQHVNMAMYGPMVSGTYWFGGRRD